MSFLAGPRRHLSYANVAATLALVVALGGTSYATTQLGKGEVKGANLAKGSVTSPKVKNGSLRAADFARGQLPAGVQGPVGAQGPPGPFVTEVPSGRTVSGVWAVSIQRPTGLGDGARAWSAQSFPFPIRGPLEAHVGSSVSLPAACHVGSDSVPAPDPGHLCVVEIGGATTGSPPVSPPSVTIGNVRTSGFRLELGSGTTAPGAYSRDGVWAATAP